MPQSVTEPPRTTRQSTPPLDVSAGPHIRGVRFKATMPFYHYRDSDLAYDDLTLPKELDGERQAILAFHETRACRYCLNRLACLANSHTADSRPQHFLIHLCATCGWWESQSLTWAGPSWINTTAVLKEFRAEDDDVPLSDLRRAILRDWKSHKGLSAGRAEEIVAHVFSDTLTAEILYLTENVHSPDGGIDFVLVTREGGEHIAFQVKRRISDQAEAVESVRAFVGALALSPYEQGFYVTTARSFSRTAAREIAAATSRLQQRSLKVDLVNAHKLQQALRLTDPLGSALERLCAKMERYANGWHVLPADVLIQSPFFSDLPELSGPGESLESAVHRVLRTPPR